jgi:hypothetical protein
VSDGAASSFHTLHTLRQSVSIHKRTTRRNRSECGKGSRGKHNPLPFPEDAHEEKGEEGAAQEPHAGDDAEEAEEAEQALLTAPAAIRTRRQRASYQARSPRVHKTVARGQFEARQLLDTRSRAYDPRHQIRLTAAGRARGTREALRTVERAQWVGTEGLGRRSTRTTGGRGAAEVLFLTPCVERGKINKGLRVVLVRALQIYGRLRAGRKCRRAAAVCRKIRQAVA